MQNNEAKSTARSRVICAYYNREHKKAKHLFLDQTFAAQSHVIWWLIPVPAANVIPNLGSSTHVEPPLSGAGSNQIFVGRHRPRATCIQKWCPAAFPQGVLRCGWCSSTAWAVLAQRWRKFLGSKVYRRIPGESFPWPYLVNWTYLIYSKVKHIKVPKVPVKVWEALVHPRSGSTGFRRRFWRRFR